MLGFQQLMLLPLAAVRRWSHKGGRTVPFRMPEGGRSRETRSTERNGAWSWGRLSRVTRSPQLLPMIWVQRQAEAVDSAALLIVRSVASTNERCVVASTAKVTPLVVVPRLTDSSWRWRW